ncbi:MAG: hypothetical protein ACON35_02310 [Candidatus Marinamargulisbacteria bacterium]
MKQLSLFIITGLLLSMPSLATAHCGGCGVGAAKTVKAAAHSKSDHSHVNDLNLSKKQQAKYDQLHKDYDNQVTELKKAFDKKVLAILTADQQKKYQKKASKACCSTKNR